MTHNLENKADPTPTAQNLKSALSSLKQQFADFKKERKAEWKLFKHSFRQEISRIKKNSKNMTGTKKA